MSFLKNLGAKPLEQTESPPINQQSKELEATKAYLTAVSKKIKKTVKTTTTLIEGTTDLATGIEQWGSTVAANDSESHLGQCLATVANFEKYFADLLQTLGTSVDMKVTEPMVGFTKDEIPATVAVKKKWDSARKDYDASISKVLLLQKEKKPNPPKIQQAEQERDRLKAVYLQKGEEAFCSLLDTNEMSEFSTSEKLLTYIENFYQFFRGGYQFLREVHDTVVIPQRQWIAEERNQYELRKKKRPAGDWVPDAISGGTAAKTRMFGLPYDDLIRRDNPPSSIPAWIEKAIEFLETHALGIQGVFRVSPPKPQLDETKKRIDDAQDVDWEQLDEHVCTGAIKLFLRELPQPLLTFELYTKFVASADAEEDAVKAKAVKAVVNELPKSNLALLKRLLALMVLIERNKETNKMTATNLAVVLCPSILYPEVPDPLTMVDDIQRANRVMSLMITHYTEIFGAAVTGPKPTASKAPTTPDAASTVAAGLGLGQSTGLLSNPALSSNTGAGNAAGSSGGLPNPALSSPALSQPGLSNNTASSNHSSSLSHPKRAAVPPVPHKTTSLHNLTSQPQAPTTPTFPPSSMAPPSMAPPAKPDSGKLPTGGGLKSSGSNPSLATSSGSSHPTPAHATPTHPTPTHPTPSHHQTPGSPEVPPKSIISPRQASSSISSPRTASVSTPKPNGPAIPARPAIVGAGTSSGHHTSGHPMPGHPIPPHLQPASLDSPATTSPTTAPTRPTPPTAQPSAAPYVLPPSFGSAPSVDSGPRIDLTTMRTILSDKKIGSTLEYFMSLRPLAESTSTFTALVLSRKPRDERAPELKKALKDLAKSIKDILASIKDFATKLPPELRNRLLIAAKDLQDRVLSAAGAFKEFEENQAGAEAKLVDVTRLLVIAVCGIAARIKEFSLVDELLTSCDSIYSLVDSFPQAFSEDSTAVAVNTNSLQNASFKLTALLRAKILDSSMQNQQTELAACIESAETETREICESIKALLFDETLGPNDLVLSAEMNARLASLSNTTRKAESYYELLRVSQNPTVTNAYLLAPIIDQLNTNIHNHVANPDPTVQAIVSALRTMVDQMAALKTIMADFPEKRSSWVDGINAIMQQLNAIASSTKSIVVKTSDPTVILTLNSYITSLQTTSILLAIVASAEAFDAQSCSDSLPRSFSAFKDFVFISFPVLFSLRDALLLIEEERNHPQ